ncbi:MAG: hypothetical protein U1E62_07785 [Alsobacter sp.]
MPLASIGVALEAALRAARGRLDFVVTDAPADEASLFRILDEAIAMASRHRLPLRAISLDMEHYPTIGPTYWHVEVRGNGAPGLVRLSFETAAEEAA